MVDRPIGSSRLLQQNRSKTEMSALPSELSMEVNLELCFAPRRFTTAITATRRLQRSAHIQWL
jgi:hypothetical protein